MLNKQSFRRLQLRCDLGVYHLRDPIRLSWPRYISFLLRSSCDLESLTVASRRDIYQANTGEALAMTQAVLIGFQG